MAYSSADRSNPNPLVADAVLEVWVRGLGHAADEILADVGPPSEPVAVIVFTNPHTGRKHLASVFGFTHIEAAVRALRERGRPPSD